MELLSWCMDRETAWSRCGAKLAVLKTRLIGSTQYRWHSCIGWWVTCSQPTDKSSFSRVWRNTWNGCQQSKGQSDWVAVCGPMILRTENDPYKEEWAQEHRWSDCSDTMEATERQSVGPVGIFALCGVSPMLLKSEKDDATVKLLNDDSSRNYHHRHGNCTDTEEHNIWWAVLEVSSGGASIPWTWSFGPVEICVPCDHYGRWEGCKKKSFDF